jgi:hypothetical protein
MSIIRITSNAIERYTLQTNPSRTFSSASKNVQGFMSSGITGTLPLFSDGTSRMKDVFADVGIGASASNDAQIENMRATVLNAAADSTNYEAAVLGYLTGVNQLPSSPTFSKRQSVFRVEPGSKLNADFQRKRVVKESLFPYYRYKYPSLQYSYTNYHTLNFVTCSSLPESTALIYPAGTGTVALEDVNFYAPSSSFTFDFYVNPRYQEERRGDEYNAGTILHMSASYAISIVSGTSKDLTGRSDAYRLVLQLSQSAQIPPKNLTISGDTVTAIQNKADTGFIFLSKDNSLRHNTWHHVAIRWGGPEVQNGTGSFYIDGVQRGTFSMPSLVNNSVMAPIQTAPNYNDADAVFVGNFYEGSNFGNKPIAGFFNSTAATEFGVVDFSPNGNLSDPSDYTLRHPLNAEIHDLKIYNNYRSDTQVYSSSIGGAKFSADFARPGVTGSNQYLSGTSAEDGLIFYVPPFFTKESPRRYVNQTPFFFVTGTTNDPFNAAMSFGVGGREMNLQNFTREFVRGFYPRQLGLEAARISTTTSEALSANDLIYLTPSNRKRNITVLPCDNGRFYPNFSVLLSGSDLSADSGTNLDRYRDDFGSLDLSRIDLSEMVSTGSLLKIFDPQDVLTGDKDGSILSPLLGATPEDPGVSPGNILTVLQRTKDPSSNEVIIFDISNMFYGDQLKPGSVVLTDHAITGTSGRVQMTLKDDGYGNLYRADSQPPHATWSSVGNVIYEEGIVIVKSPNIPLFGADSWEISFEGERNIHVLEVNVLADKGLINSSTNPTFQKLIPTDSHAETAEEFVYLTGLQLHDDNLNVLGRANLAQPIVKRNGDRFTIRLRMDF